MSAARYCWFRGAFAVALISLLSAARAEPSQATPEPAAEDARAEPARVLVLPFEPAPAMPGDASRGDMPGNARALARTLAFDLSAAPSIHALEGEEVAASAGAARDAGRAAEARFVVWGMVQTAGGRVRVSGQLLDLEAGEEAVDHFKLTGPADEWFEMQDALSARVERQVLAAVAPLAAEDPTGQPEPREADPAELSAAPEVPPSEPLRIAPREADDRPTWAAARHGPAEYAARRDRRGLEPYWHQSYGLLHLHYGFIRPLRHHHHRHHHHRHHHHHHGPNRRWFGGYTYRGLPEWPTHHYYGAGGLGRFLGPVPLHWLYR